MKSQAFEQLENEGKQRSTPTSDKT